MANFLIVTEKTSDWSAFFPSDRLISVADYLDQGGQKQGHNTLVLNLCRSYAYQSLGYYCSLLGEARGQRVLPSVQTINELDRGELQLLAIEGMQEALDRAFPDTPSAGVQSLLICFGLCQQPLLHKLARQLFERFPLPLMRVKLRRGRVGWQLMAIKPATLNKLDDSEQDLFAQALERFSSKVWRRPGRKRQARYDLAILVDPKEALPPSDAVALKQFSRAGQRLGVNVELIHPDQISRLAEFDALFIRATTNLSNFTYRFARRAEALGLVVMDDPESIRRCTNKVYLAELLAGRKVAAPKTLVLRQGERELVERVERELGYPCVLKLPDGAFSIGVVKVSDRAELNARSAEMLKHSALILAQEYMFTEYDWRIGILNRQPLYACKYFMSRGHWQIYQHGADGEVDSGGWETMDIAVVPRCVRDTALKAANLIGDGFYGVDLKQVGDRAYVIEVNDNPSIDSEVEDAFLGELLYERVMLEFLRRLQLRGL